MSYTKNPLKENPSGFLYSKGKESVDGSIRLSINPFTGITRIEKREAGIWKPASFEVDSSSVWVGPSVGIGGVGSHLITENPDGLFHLFAHNDFDGELTTCDAKIINAYQFIVRDVIVSDDSGEWIGKAYAYNYPSPDHRMLRKAYYKTGSTPATSPVRLQVWKGFDDTGPLIFDQTYFDGIFINNTEVIVIANGFVEFEKDINYYVMLSSEENFSLRTTFDQEFPWSAGDVSLVREDDMLEAIPYEDGETYNKDQWAIQGKKIYICNVTGAQTGTFASNSDKWDLLSTEIGDVLKSVIDPTGKNSDAFSMANMDETTTKKVLTNTERSEIAANTSKLSGIQAGAQVNQSDSQIKSQYENNSNTNAFVDAEKSKLASLESSKFLGEFISKAALESTHPSPDIGQYANVDAGAGNDVQRYVWDDNDSKYVLQLGESTILTDSQIKQQYEANPDTNPFTDSNKSKLNGIEAGAESNVQSDWDQSDTGADDYIKNKPATASADMEKSVYDQNDNGVVDNSEKLEGQDSSYHLSRSNHTGSQPASTINDFDTEVSNNSAVSINTAKRTYPLADENKLSGIEALAEVNQTDSEIKTQYENNANTNSFTDAEKSKVSALESSKFLGEFVSLVALQTAHPSPVVGSYANVDQGIGQDVVRYVWDNDDSVYVLQLGESTILTDAQIKTQYENNPDTNDFTDSEESKLLGVEALAEVNQSDSEIKSQYEANSNTNAYTDAEESKLLGIEAGAEVNVPATSADINATSYTTTTSTSDELINGMASTPGAGNYIAFFSSSWENDNTETMCLSIYINGVKDEASERRYYVDGSIPDTPLPVATQVTVNGLGDGEVIDVRWRTTNGTAKMHQRKLTILKL